MRAAQIEDADDDAQPTWNIWRYELESDSLSRVMAADAIAEAGQDTAPVFLPDGRIVFSSTRQQANQAILLDENKPQYQSVDESRRRTASVLHVMNADGSNIQQISFNQSHDLDPTVLSTGKILFSRWDNAGNNSSINLYQMNADGSELEIVYGRHSHRSERSTQFLHYTQMRELPDGRVISALRPMQNDDWGGDYVTVDIQHYVDRQTPFANMAGTSASAEQSALFADIVIDSPVSPSGKIAAVYPLWDGSGRVLYSWNQCRVWDPEPAEGETSLILPCNDSLLANPDIQAAPLAYGLWIYDPRDNTQLPIAVPQSDVIYTEVLALKGRAFPADAQQSPAFDPELAFASLAQVHIRSVYDFAGIDSSEQGIAVLADPSQTPAQARPARFLRIVKAVSQPDDATRDFKNSAFGRSSNQLMREIVGYAVVEPDGSALFTVPVNVPLAFSVLDAFGQRISERHQNWLQFAAGEQRTCNGCHSQISEAPHGRMAAEAASINPGAPATGQAFLHANPALFADMGETMAQTAGRINGVAYPSPNIEFTDIWTDPALQTPSASYRLAYADMQSAIPISPACATTWTPLCRIEINYPVHIQALFDLDRPVLAEDGISEQAQHRCTSCHNSEDAAGLAQVPAGQLDLRGLDSSDNPDHLISYRELLFNDNEQTLVEGLLVDRLVPVLDSNGDAVFATDDEGELILDSEGNAIPVTTTVSINPILSVNGARSSQDFFALFQDNGSHAHWLSPAELKLMVEWLDLGGQYYNNPFVAPVN